MTNFPRKDLACVLCPQKLVEDMHGCLERPDPLGYAELRLLAAARLREMPMQQPGTLQLGLELQLLDFLATLYMCSPADALAVFRQVDATLAVEQQDAAVNRRRAQLRYIATVRILQTGLAPWRLEALPQLREAALAGRPEKKCLLRRAMLIDALISGEEDLTTYLYQRLDTFELQSTKRFDFNVLRLCVALLKDKAEPWMLALLLQSCQSFGDWHLLEGPLWFACLHSGIVDRASWKLHLEAPARCHDKLYECNPAL
jgi:hypothetical protein